MVEGGGTVMDMVVGVVTILVRPIRTGNERRGVSDSFLIE